jgi:hypothetical protein
VDLNPEPRTVREEGPWSIASCDRGGISGLDRCCDLGILDPSLLWLLASSSVE